MQRLGTSLVFLSFILILTACGDNGGVETEPEEYTITITAKEGSQILSGVTFFEGSNVIEANTETISITRTENTTLSVRAEKDDYMENAIEITFNRNKSETIALTKNDPDNATINYTITNENEEQINDARLFIADSVAGDAGGSITLPFGDSPVELCGRAEYYEETCTPVTPNRSSRDIAIELKAEMVDVTVSSVTNAENGASIDDAQRTVGDYTYETGETTHSFAARSGTREVVVYASGTDTLSQQIAASESHILNLELTVLPECSNGLNDDADDTIDAEDIGCVDENGNYDPADDVEKTITVSNSFSSSSDVKRFVSSKAGERKIALIANTFPREVKFALGEVRFYLELKQEAMQDGEITQIEFMCREEGSSIDYDSRPTHISEIIPDTGKDGWQELPVHGFTKAMFKNDGLDCASRFAHASESAAGGNDDVVLTNKNHPRNIRYEADFEPEDVPGFGQ